MRRRASHFTLLLSFLSLRCRVRPKTERGNPAGDGGTAASDGGRVRRRLLLVDKGQPRHGEDLLQVFPQRGSFPGQGEGVGDRRGCGLWDTTADGRLLPGIKAGYTRQARSGEGVGVPVRRPEACSTPPRQERGDVMGCHDKHASHPSTSYTPLIKQFERINTQLNTRSPIR